MSTRTQERNKAESAYSKGGLKIKFGRLKRDGEVENGVCDFCAKPVLKEPDGIMYNDGSYSQHKCKGFIASKESS